QDPTYQLEPLATLGDSLALCRVSLSAGGLARGSLDVGAYEKGQIHLIEAGAEGRGRRGEEFAVDRLGDARVRLYERYAELVPDPLERNRIASISRAIAAQVGPPDFDRVAATLAPGVESVDHRILGTWSAHGAEAVLQNLRAFFDLSDNIAVRDDDVL